MKKNDKVNIELPDGTLVTFDDWIERDYGDLSTATARQSVCEEQTEETAVLLLNIGKMK